MSVQVAMSSGFGSGIDAWTPSLRGQPRGLVVEANL